MGNLILIFGPNGSGKSAFAESLLADVSGPKYYIATMVPQTAENESRIEAHRRRRAGQGYCTIEAPGSLGDVTIPDHSFVLLEDVSNLLANVMFGAGGTAESVFTNVLALSSHCAQLVAVTISGLTPDGYESETAAYINALNRLNEQLLDAAEAAIVMENGKPRVVKGEIDGVS